MTKEQQQVKEFMLAAQQECPSKPTKLSNPIRKLREALIEEEFHELKIALWKCNLVETADAIGDLMYVILGTAVASGIDMESIFQEIHRSNMSKFKDGYINELGKVVKGPSYSPAILTPLIEAQKKL
jgi:predicted HAD superfamily Cof-like phosphohydrolase